MALGAGAGGVVGARGVVGLSSVGVVFSTGVVVWEKAVGITAVVPWRVGECWGATSDRARVRVSLSVLEV